MFSGIHFLHGRLTVHLMGHASKQMVYKVYGKKIENLEKGRHTILECFGRDFIDSSGGVPSTKMAMLTVNYIPKTQTRYFLHHGLWEKYGENTALTTT